MSYAFLFKRLFAGLAVAAFASGVCAAPAAADAAGPRGQCTVSIQDPVQGGDYVWAYARWDCSLLPPDGGAKTYLTIYRDGAVAKTSEFWEDGAFNYTYGTGVRCVGGTHTYYAHTHGWDSDHISYNLRSRDVSLPC